jgi:hypothetical protein
MVDAAQIVIPYDNVERATAKLTSCGFVVDGRTRMAGFGLPTRVTHEGGGQIDVRASVYGPGWSGAPDRHLWKRRIAMQLDGWSVQTLALSDAVAAAVTFGLTTPLPTYQWLVDLAMLAQSKSAVSWTDLTRDYRDTLLSVPISEALRIIEAEIPRPLIPESGTLMREMSTTPRQRLQFWFHRRGRRLVRLPAWYRRGVNMAGDDRSVGFASFVKGVYDVNSTGDALAKAFRRIRRGVGNRSI